MAYQLYIIPMELVQPTGTYTIRRVKYLHTIPDLQYGSLDYGKLNHALVAADVTPAQHAAIIANTDVIAFNANLDAQVGGGSGLNNLRDALEVVILPGNWVNSNTTWREVARAIAGVMLFGQKHEALWDEELIPNRAALSLTWSAISPDRRNRILTTGKELNYDMSFITNNMTVRAILRELANLWAEESFQLHNYSF